MKDIKFKRHNDLFGIAIVSTTNQKREIIMFSSDKEKQEWITKIRKVQKSGKLALQ